MKNHCVTIDVVAYYFEVLRNQTKSRSKDLREGFLTSEVSVSGERVDFVLTGDQPVGNYWLQANTAKDCDSAVIKGSAILRYEDSDDSETIPPAAANTDLVPNSLTVSQLFVFFHLNFEVLGAATFYSEEAWAEIWATKHIWTFYLYEIQMNRIMIKLNIIYTDFQNYYRKRTNFSVRVFIKILFSKIMQYNI